MMGDLRYALRMLRKTPGLTLVAVLSLALGIGANTTIFSWMDGLVLHPLPLVKDPGRLVFLKTLRPGGAEWSASYPDFLDWRAQARSVSDLSVAGMDQFGVKTSGQAERAWGVYASADYFNLLGVHPLMGRLFRPDEASMPGSAPVAVIGYDFWQRKFAGDANVVGRHLTLNSHDFTVVGVLPPKFGGTIVGLAFDVWVPITMEPLLSARGSSLDQRGRHWLNAIARLKPGVTVAEARADIALVQRRLAATYDDDRSTTALVAPLASAGLQAWLRPLFIALLGITGVVLLVACANVANLLLARATARQKEIAVRLALGAGRWQLVRQLLIESALLAGLGGAVGLFIALWGQELFAAFVPPAPFPIELQFGVNGRVVGFAIVATGLAALLFGSAPAFRASRPDLVPALKDDTGQRGVSRSRLRSTLVVAQLALSVVALVAAGLFLRSLGRSKAVDRGFGDPRHVLVVSTDLFAAAYDRATGTAFVNRLLDRVSGMPGVRSASVSMFVPLGFSDQDYGGVTVEAYQPRRDEDMSLRYTAVGPDYFATMETPIVRGRPIAAADRDSALQVAVVNETFARHFWPGLDPIGRRLSMRDGEWITVVGVAKDGKYDALDEAPLPFIFRPFAQFYVTQPNLIVRTAGDPKALIEPIKRAFASLDPNAPFLDPRTLEEHIGPSVFIQRTGATLLGGFGALALLMAAIGIYGVMAYVVSQRTREMGIRVALGAGRREIVGLVLGQATGLVGAGLAIGAAAAFGVGVLLQSQLFGIKAYDVPTFAAILLMLAAVALLACWIPARRAARVDPVVALKYE
jgi:putative ABC transport system permease protein